MSDLLDNFDAENQLTSPLYTITYELAADMDESHVEMLKPALEDMALAITSQRDKVPNDGPWRLTWLVDFIPDRTEIEATLNRAIAMNGWDALSVSADNPRIESVVQENWLEKCYQTFAPFEVGGFFIYGSHYEGGVPEGLTGLQIDAATAFGSGEHGTTKGCLLALEDLVAEGFKPAQILDVGSGSGILAIAGYKRYNVPCLATDNDRECVRVAALHRDLNDVPADALRSVYGEGYDVAEIKSDQPFDLIFANILAAPLRELAPDLAANLSKDGYAILSGMLVDQADSVLEAHTPHGLELKEKYEIDGWATLILSY